MVSRLLKFVRNLLTHMKRFLPPALGGAIDGHRRSDRLTVSLADVHVSGCFATDTGGAVFLTAAGLGAVVDGTLAMAACTFYDNSADCKRVWL